VSTMHTRYAVECIGRLARVARPERRYLRVHARPLQVGAIGHKALGVGYPHGGTTPWTSAPSLCVRADGFRHFRHIAGAHVASGVS
jgi:hypothetical protein